MAVHSDQTKDEGHAQYLLIIPMFPKSWQLIVSYKTAKDIRSPCNFSE